MHPASKPDIGPFIIQREALNGRLEFKTLNRGWSPSRDKAWKFDSEQAAKFVLKRNAGEVVPLETK